MGLNAMSDGSLSPEEINNLINTYSSEKSKIDTEERFSLLEKEIQHLKKEMAVFNKTVKEIKKAIMGEF
jgi:chaperonin cofactor prefoldin